MESEIRSAEAEIKSVAESIEDHADRIALADELGEIQELVAGFKSSDNGLGGLVEELSVHAATSEAKLNRLKTEAGGGEDQSWKTAGATSSVQDRLAQLRGTGNLIEHDAVNTMDKVS
ncbi:MAG: hypothetical protein PHC51_03100 [bacterium]|nr:hypothetical protein [bacterium]